MLDEVQARFGTRDFVGVHVRVEADWEVHCAENADRTAEGSALFGNSHQCWVRARPHPWRAPFPGSDLCPSPVLCSSSTPQFCLLLLLQDSSCHATHETDAELHEHLSSCRRCCWKFEACRVAAGG